MHFGVGWIWYGGVAGAEATVGLGLGVFPAVVFRFKRTRARGTDREIIYACSGGSALYYMRCLHRKVAAVTRTVYFVRSVSLSENVRNNLQVSYIKCTHSRTP